MLLTIYSTLIVESLRFSCHRRNSPFFELELKYSADRYMLIYHSNQYK